MRAVVVDDEPLARQRLRRLLEGMDGVEVVAECKSGRAAIAVTAEQRPDVVFLDIRMPGLDGLDVAREVAAHADTAPILVFVTAFEEHALSAFDRDAVDYVIKPVDPDRLRRAVDRVRHRLALEQTSEQHEELKTTLHRVASDYGSAEPAAPRSGGGRAAFPQRLLVREEGRRFFVPVADIEWVEASRNHVRLHVAAQAHLIRMTIGRLEALLDPLQFARVHRSTIVNLDAVREVQPWFGGDHIIILKNGGQVKLSRTYRQRFEERGRA